MKLKGIGWEVVEWIILAQDRDQGRDFGKAVINLQVPQNVGKFLSTNIMLLDIIRHPVFI
jgi:hypothetical protein